MEVLAGARHEIISATSEAWPPEARWTSAAKARHRRVVVAYLWFVSNDETMVLSVRGEGRRTVNPDAVTFSGGLTLWEQDRVAALSGAAEAVGGLTGALADLGGAARRAGNDRAALTWSVFSATTQMEWRHDKETGQSEPTGRVAASVAVAITVRDFELLDALGRVLAGDERLDVRRVAWKVDDDNPAWAAVRAEAIAAALRRGRDYAAALGVDLQAVEHVADTGLLAGTGEGPARFKMARAMSAGGEIDTPSLDPVPQEVVALIEARFRASAAILRN